MMTDAKIPGRARLLESALRTACAVLALGLTVCLGDSGGDADPGDLASAHRLFGQGRCGEALARYELALASDSMLSAAYYGAIKSTLCAHEVDAVASAFQLSAGNDSSAGSGLSIRGASFATLDRYYAAIRRARAFHAPWLDRDTLTRYWRYLDGDHLAEELADPHYAARRAMMEFYLQRADEGEPGHRPRAAFPLVDSSVALNVGAAPEVYAAWVLDAWLRLHDFDDNDTLDARDSILLSLLPVPD